MEFKIAVITGDQIGAGTDANVSVILHDAEGKKSQTFSLAKRFRNDFESGHTDEFFVKVNGDVDLGHVSMLELWRDSAGAFSSWFLTGVNVYRLSNGERSTFPVHTWVKEKRHYRVNEYNTSLPQFDAETQIRKQHLEEKRNAYQFVINSPGLPIQVKDLPDDEKFSWHYKWDLLKLKLSLILTCKVKKLLSANWDDISDISQVYNNSTMPEPRGVREWRDDLGFARQRTHGCSIGLIKLCTHIPDKLGVTDEMLQPFLEGYTLADIICHKRLFMVDLEVMTGLPSMGDCHLCSPIALFYERSDKKLTPVAIQLEQQKGQDNPVFLPSDPEYTWLMAKMWYNNADCCYHQSCTHLGLTHIMMEGMCASANRQLSQSHPIYRLLAPHFLYVIAINTRALEFLVSKGGWIDTTMSCGVVGLFELAARETAGWRVDVDGTLPAELAQRGVLDALTNYPYRDDAILIYNAIRNYVTKIVGHYYDTPDKFTGDWELQNWGKELVLAKEKGGVGLKGVPGEGRFTDTEQLVTLLTCIIHTCSVAHAASNFPQYDEYAFPPNYPSLMRGTPPKTKNALQVVDILNVLPNKKTTLDVVVVTKILSSRGTKPLADFEVEYTFDPPAKQIVKQFQQELVEVSSTIDDRNKTRDPPYTILHPLEVPNSISI